MSRIFKSLFTLCGCIELFISSLGLLGGNNFIAPVLWHLSGMTGAYRVLPPIKQGESADIECHPRDMGTMTIWFRILDKAGMEFIASFSNGIPKNTEGRPSSSFSFSKISKHIVTLQSFDRNKDSGLYSCSSLVKGKELVFGEATRLVGGEFCFMNLA